MRIWIASFLFYCSTYIICEILRFFVEKYFHKNANNSKLFNVDARVIALEFIGTIQVCLPMFDVNLVLDHYGLSGVLFEIAFIELCNAILLRDALADPCQLFGQYVKGKFAAITVVILLGVQFCAAYISYFFARFFWSFEFHPLHLQYFHQACASDLTVTIIYGSLVEAGGFLAVKLAELLLEKNVEDSNMLRFSTAFISGVITILGIGLTGMYANPIVAWACTFNCGEVSHLAHFVVYWLAPFAAWFAYDRFINSD